MDSSVPPEEREYTTCQLHMRHWEIEDATTGRVDHVSGEGVVGKMPVFEDGGWVDKGQAGDMQRHTGVFVYQSCSGNKGGGSFGGRITMVGGELNSPSGIEFDLPVPPFPLQKPSFIH